MTRRLALLALSIASLARADTVWLGDAPPGTPRADVRILRVQAGKLYYEFQGRETDQPLARIHRMNVTGEDAFNTAEEAYLTQKFDAAVDGYQKTVRATNKPWLKDWATLRLVDAATKSNRFDAAVTAYIAIVLKDPATATQSKPALPEGKSAFLDTAAKEIELATKQKLTDDQAIPLLTMLVDVQRQRGDAAAESKADEALFTILSKNPDNPDIAPAIARRKLQSAMRKLESKDYAGAAAEVKQNAKMFIDPSLQADALYILAEASYANATSKNDPAALQDAALAYMRLVANCKDAPGSPRVAYALLKTGEISEALKDNAAAANLYGQVVTQFPSDPAAVKAAAAAKRLQGGG